MSWRLQISAGLTSSELRNWAWRCGSGRAAAARLAGMERQALRYAMIRYNAEGAAGFSDCRKDHAPKRLTKGEQALLAQAVYKAPSPRSMGCARGPAKRWPAGFYRRVGKSLPPNSVSRVLRRMGLSWQKTRPRHPRQDPKAGERFQKEGSRTR